MKIFELHFDISNNGDGSASIRMHPTKEAAEKAAENEEGWGEPLNDSIKLKLEDGKIFYEDHDEETYKPIWIPLQETKL